MYDRDDELEYVVESLLGKAPGTPIHSAIFEHYCFGEVIMLLIAQPHKISELQYFKNQGMDNETIHPLQQDDIDLIIAFRSFVNETLFPFTDAMGPDWQAIEYMAFWEFVHLKFPSVWQVHFRPSTQNKQVKVSDVKNICAEVTGGEIMTLEYRNCNRNAGYWILLKT